MKKILLIFAAVAAVMSCNKYEFNTEFTAPTELLSISSLDIDVASGEIIELTWKGGEAADGGVLLYDVLFDKADGDFSEPIASMRSDNGALPSLSLQHKDINKIARNAGIPVSGTGTIKWTVAASRGGVTKLAGVSKEISLKRGDAIDVPEALYLYGTAGEAEGIRFNMPGDGIFHVYTTLKDGNVIFSSSQDEADATYYYVAGGKVHEGKGDMKVSATAGDELARIVVDFAKGTMTVQKVKKEIKYVLGINGDIFETLSYKGNGIFSYTGMIPYVADQWGAGAHEERYYFNLTIDGSTCYWGRGAGVSAEQPRPDEGIDFFRLYE